MRRTVSLTASETFYLPPGHGNEPGTQVVQFSPSEQLAEVAAVMTHNMQALHVD
jgi:hypothetical protein